MKNFLILFISIPCFLFAQNRTLTGVVFDNDGNPLPGATIQVINSNNIGAITDFDGNFSLLIDENETKIEVSYIGFLPQTIDVSNRTSITINLELDVSELEEVVVIGYGTVLKKDLSGSVASIKVEDDISRQSSTIDQLLQGRASGVQVTQNTANPNSGISVRVRGTNSLRGNNEPLYVVDGIIVSSAGEDVDAVGGGNTGQERQSGLNGINPRDIERIEVLKDASATAIYGSRGANGVILITTKKGDSKQGVVNTYFNRSYREVSKRLDVLGPIDYARYSNAANALADRGPHWHINGEIYGIQNYDGSNPVILDTQAKYYNWHDEIYKIGESNNFGASFSGGSENGTYYVSAGLNDQRGLIDNSRFKSGDFRVNLNQKLNEKLDIEARFSAFFSDSDFSEGGDLIGNYQSFVRNILSFRPIYKVAYDDLTDPLVIYDQELTEGLDGPEDNQANPFSWVDDFHDESIENRFFANLSLKYKLPIRGLNYELRIGGNKRDKERRRFYGPTTFQGKTNIGLLQISTIDQLSYQINNFIRYNRNFNNKHRVNATFGTTYDVRDVTNSIYSVSGFDSFELTTQQPFLGQNILTPLADIARDQKMFSLLGRVNYTLRNNYIFTASFRRDGVSKFKEENRYGFFPSFAFAYRRDFGTDSSFKIRTGWGQIGNHGIGPYGTLSNYGSDPDSIYGSPNNGTTVPLILNNLANPDLTWETTEQLNFGLDLDLFGGRVTSTIDVYEKLTKDLLQNAPIPTSSGFSSILINRGQLENKGIEVGLDISLVELEDFSFTIGGNISQNKSKIMNLGLPPGNIFKQDYHRDSEYYEKPYYLGQQISRGNIFKHPANIFMEGQESALFYGWKTDGLVQQDEVDDYPIAGAQAGDIKIVDLNQDGVIDNLDTTIIGNPNPNYVYGFNFNLKVKDFTLSALFNGVEGNEIANGWNYTLGIAEGSNGQGGATYTRNVFPDTYFDAWSPTNTDAQNPRIGYTTQNIQYMLDTIIEDGSFLRLNNITLNWELPVNKFNNRKLLNFSSMNIFITGQNLFTWTNYSGYDPEVTSFMWTGLIQGVDWNGPPNAKNILLGVNVNF